MRQAHIWSGSPAFIRVPAALGHDHIGSICESRVSTMLLTYLYLFVAIIFEVIATTALKQTDGFTRLLPSLMTILGYALAFYFLALTLRTRPVGIVYAIWSGAGIILITAIGWLLFRQSLDLPALVGMGLIMAGVLVINLFSKSVVH
jgi:small multidrug resistance pump